MKTTKTSWRVFIGVALAALLSPISAQGAGVFNGSANLTVADNLVGSAPGCPVLFACWVKLNNVTASHSLIYVHDNSAGGSLDMLELLIRGQSAGDPVQ